jgi:hypothetical protein
MPKSFTAPLDSIALSDEEQAQLIGPEETRAHLLMNLGLMQIDLVRKTAWTEQAIEKLAKEQAMVGEQIVNGHGKDPTLDWVYDSSRKVIERKK